MSNPLTPARLAEIEARAALETWTEGCTQCIYTTNGILDIPCAPHADLSAYDPSADVPDLCKALRDAWAEVERLKEDCEVTRQRSNEKSVAISSWEAENARLRDEVAFWKASQKNIYNERDAIEVDRQALKAQLADAAKRLWEEERTVERVMIQRNRANDQLARARTCLSAIAAPGHTFPRELLIEEARLCLSTLGSGE